MLIMWWELTIWMSLLLRPDPVRPSLRRHGAHGELGLHAAVEELQGAVPRMRRCQVWITFLREDTYVSTYPPWFQYLVYKYDYMMEQRCLKILFCARTMSLFAGERAPRRWSSRSLRRHVLVSQYAEEITLYSSFRLDIVAISWGKGGHMAKYLNRPPSEWGGIPFL